MHRSSTRRLPMTVWIILGISVLAYLGYVQRDEGWPGVRHLLLIPLAIPLGIAYLFFGSLVWLFEIVKDLRAWIHEQPDPLPR